MTAIRSAGAADLLAYFGLEKDQPDRGISLAHFDTDTGRMSPPQMIVQVTMPGYLLISPDGRHLYSVNATTKFQGQPGGGLSAYSIDRPSGQLSLINQQSSGGANPVFLVMDAAATHLLTANYTGGNISVFALRPDGGIGQRTGFVQHSGHSINPSRQKEPHPHSIYVDPSDKFVLVPDLGQDKVFVYRYDNMTGSLTPNDPPYGAVAPGAGPRHLAFHPNGRWVYVIDEMAGTVTRFNWDSQRGTLTQPQTTPTLAVGFTGTDTSGEIRIDRTGRFLYATNRGPNDLVVFSIDPQSGDLTFVQRVPTEGKMPRFMTFDPTEQWLIVCNHDSDNALTYRVDAQTGRLTRTGDPFAVPNPFCLVFPH